MSLAVLFYFLCAQHVSDINISIIRSLWLCCWITTLVVLFFVVWVVSVLQASACNTDTTQTQLHQISNTQLNKNKTTDVVIQQHSRRLLMMDILMSETCWVHKKWNKIASDIKLVFHSSAITMVHGPINISIFRMSAIQITAGTSTTKAEIFWWFFATLPSEFHVGVWLLGPKLFPIFLSDYHSQYTVTKDTDHVPSAPHPSRKLRK